MKIVPKNWHTFQHYRDRKPTWIKLHRALLDDYEFSQLPVGSRALAPMLWLIASEAKDGCIDMSIEALSFRLRMASVDVADSIEPLILKGFFEDASDLLADGYQFAIPEREKETEREKEKDPTQESETVDQCGTRESSNGAAFLGGNTVKHSRSKGFEIPELQEAM